MTLKKKSSWVLCWEQPVPCPLSAPFVPNPELHVAFGGILLGWGTLGCWRVIEAGKGPLSTGCLPINQGGIGAGNRHGEECEGVVPGLCGVLLADSSILTNSVN